MSFKIGNIYEIDFIDTWASLHNISKGDSAKLNQIEVPARKGISLLILLKYHIIKEMLYCIVKMIKVGIPKVAWFSPAQSLSRGKVVYLLLIWFTKLS